ncbi:FecR family protein [Sphingobacterium nematocida]|uniref:FecR family protein n=1 Tax=Sphingobacterium nematocida TaxID=1513896 RepID=A0A1T5DFC0_9SPHI|nr:FecR family protein [Sphingobacterium nematocida]SKB70402.1 FecR family protein [Sphingobacterium nematocida]
MQKDYFDELIRRYKENKLTQGERQVLDEWLDSIQYPYSESTWTSAEKSKLKKGILSDIKVKTVTPLWNRVAVAASLIALLGMGYLFYNNHQSSPNEPIVAKVDSIKPGEDKGILYREGGEEVLLNTLKADSVYQFDQLLVERISDNQIKVRAMDHASGTLQHIHAPKGGNFMVQLEDGSALTLNANSSVSFPARFSDSERRVSAIGEVFFEVKKDRHKRPFIVSLGSTSIKVLGTKFNVNYKEGEGLRTALFEGAVLVSNPKFEVYLKPGKELLADQSGNYSVKSFVNEQVGAWKEGYFSLDNKNIAEIMDEVGNWYNVDIDYADANLAVRYQGNISKFSDIHTVLDILSLAKGNTFEVKGRRVMVK